jgi:PAS domain-containing protein
VHRADSLTPNEVGQDQNPPTAACCRRAPPVLEFDPAGNLVRSWGGPGQGFTWPGSNHGIFVDHKGFVWIGGNGNADSHVLKFTQDGKFVAEYGKPGQGATRASNAMDRFGRVAKIFVDPRANEAYLADGYFNRRVAVLDADLRIEVWNERASELWGLRADEVRGQSFLALDIGLPVHDIARALRTCLAGDSREEKLSVTAVSRRVRTIGCRVTCTPLRSALDAPPRGLIIVTEEIPAAVAVDSA